MAVAVNRSANESVFLFQELRNAALSHEESYHEKVRLYVPVHHERVTTWGVLTDEDELRQN